MSWEVKTGNCLDVLSTLEAGSAQTCVTSPPYFGLRDYGTATWEGGDETCEHRRFNAYPSTLAGTTQAQDAGKFFKGRCELCGARRADSQIGLEETPEQYVAKLVEVFREVRRVLRDDGTLWLNIGDSYNGGGGYSPNAPSNLVRGDKFNSHAKTFESGKRKGYDGLKPKDLIGIPWLLAFALRADGWYLRSDIIWHKPNPMPESVTDRPTKAHEYIFLLSKSSRYFYDADAVREPHSREWWGESVGGPKICTDRKDGGNRQGVGTPDGRNRRSVWTVATKPFPEAHFATFPEQLIEPCILAGSREGDLVIDPFSGTGTTGAVALKHGRKYLGCELNPEYVEMQGRRLAVAQAMALRAKGIPADVPKFNRREIETPLFGSVS